MNIILRIGGWLQNLWYRLLTRLGARAMVDLSQLNPQLYTGGAITSDADVEYMAHLGITADIDCRLEFDDKSLIAHFDNLPSTPASLKTHPKIAYCYDGVADDGEPKPVSWFKTAWDFADPILRNDGVIAVHCAAGHNRGPSIAYFLLRSYWKMSGDEAFALIKEKRPVATVNYRPDADEAILALNL